MEQLGKVILNIVNWVKPIGPFLLIGVLIISGICCFFGSTGRKMALGFIIGGLIGTVLVLGGESLANEIIKNITF